MKRAAERAATWSGPMDRVTGEDDGETVGGRMAANMRSTSPVGALGTHDALFASAWSGPHRALSNRVGLGRRVPDP